MFGKRGETFRASSFKHSYRMFQFFCHMASMFNALSSDQIMNMLHGIVFNDEDVKWDVK
jgi:hypothetical protein